MHFARRKCQDLIDVFQSIRVTAQAEIDQRHQERRDVLNAQIRSGLRRVRPKRQRLRRTHPDELNDLLPEDLEKLDVLGNPAELFHGALLALALVERRRQRRPVFFLAIAFTSSIRGSRSSAILGLCLALTLRRRRRRRGRRRPDLIPSTGDLASALLARPRSPHPLHQPARCLLLPLASFLRVLILRLARGIRREPIDERNHDLLDVDARMEGGGGGEKRPEGVQVEVVGEDLCRGRARQPSLRRSRNGASGGRYLDDDLHEVLLRNHIPTPDDLLQHPRQNPTDVHVQIDAFELAQPDEIRADQDPQLLSLQLALFALTGMPLVLQPDPELVHLDEIRQHERDRVL